MSFLILGLIIFFSIHSLAIVGLRSPLQARMGQGGYRILHSICASIGLILIIYGFGQYRDHAWVQIWQPPPGMRHLTFLLMLIALIALAAVVLPGQIKRLLKHPLLLATSLWSLGHLLINGDLGSLLLFGCFFVWSVVDRLWLNSKGPQPKPIAPGWCRNDALAIVIGCLLWAAIAFYLHTLLIGVSVF